MSKLNIDQQTIKELFSNKKLNSLIFSRRVLPHKGTKTMIPTIIVFSNTKSPSF